ncbi:MAG: hypothetical protein JW830_12230, partial [Bacteroidales bacterium]|nr:hypothetical protein [Bacteroidales bacterium]
SVEWETGVNPMFTDFDGLGHGIQWDAASHLDLLTWAYSKINDGNIYPVVYFISPRYKQEYQAGDKPSVKIYASDPDGKIIRIELFINHFLVQTLQKEPYETSISISNGNNLLEAVAYDDGGKSSRAEIIIKTDINPVITTLTLPEGRQGDLYEYQLTASGNDPVVFVTEDPSALPEGLSLSPSGLIKGVPVHEGNFHVLVKVIDEEGDVTSGRFVLKILPKQADEVVVSNVFSLHDSLINMVSKMDIGELPNTQAGTEVSFSKVGPYAGLTYISTSSEAADFAGDSILSFTVDENVKVYIAYEKLDLLYTSTIPQWLTAFARENGPQIEAQYHYFDVYSKSYPAGKISLPGADARNNNVIRNYFVMIRKNN